MTIPWALTVTFSYVPAVTPESAKDKTPFPSTVKGAEAFGTLIAPIADVVAAGKSLAIKNQTSNQYYLYPLKKTPLELILDKNFLIDQIKKLESRIIDDKYINFKILKNNNEINIFFDKKNLNLIGWQTEDIYQNLVITYIYKIQYNQKIDKNIFKLPKMN